jgi:uroporphyrinogen-III synthase
MRDLQKVNIIISRASISQEDLPNWNHDEQIKFNYITLPLLSFQRIDSNEVKCAIERIRQNYYDVIILLSANAVNIFFEILREQSDFKTLFKNLTNMKFVVIGPKTMTALSKYGINSELANNNNSNYSSSKIIHFLMKLEEENKHKKKDKSTKILLPRSAESLKSDNYIKLNFDTIFLDQVLVYKIKDKTKLGNFEQLAKIVNRSKDYEKNFIIFTSPSAVRTFFQDIISELPQLIGMRDKEILHRLNASVILSIGPKTSIELEKRGIEYNESSNHTVKGVFELIRKFI